MGFPTGDRYKGTAEQKDRLEKQFLRKSEFMLEHKVPIWNGEFGPVYADLQDSDADSINEDRYNLLGQQLKIYDKYKISWSIWLYKDIGIQGMLHTNRDSKWNRTIELFLDKKRQHRLDAWGAHPSSEVEAALNPLVQWDRQGMSYCKGNLSRPLEYRTACHASSVPDFLECSIL